MIRLNQAFYGRDHGYRLLATSNQAESQTIEMLCASIGTPDRTSIDEPFYINFISGQTRFMICGRIATPDESGRMTLFFHIFWGPHTALLAANFGVGSLIRENAFRSSYTGGPVLPLDFDESNYSIPWGKTSFEWTKEKIAIASNKPELSLVAGFLKNEINSISWASFSFRELDNFTFYIISEFSAFPKDRKTVSLTGEVLAEPKKVKPPQDHHAKTNTVTKKQGKVIYYLLFLSILLNIGLGTCFIMWQKCDGKKNPPKEKIVEKIVRVEVPAKGLVSRQAVIKELRDEFYSQYKPLAGDWETLIRSNGALKIQYDKHKNPVLHRAKGYIDFMNNKILQEGK